MSFTDLLKEKIAARRASRSTVQITAEELRRRALERVKGVHAAVEEMVTRLAGDPIFAVAFGDPPKLVFKWRPLDGESCGFWVTGPAASIVISVEYVPSFLDAPARTKLSLGIFPEFEFKDALQCGIRYGDATPVKGDIADLAGFLVAVEDMIAEYLADVVTTSPGHRFLPRDEAP